MKRLSYALGISLSILFIACNDNAGSTADESTADTSTTSTSTTGTSDTSSTSAATTPASLDAVMSKMMQDMHGMTMTNDADHDFAMMMKRHHEGAIEMANIELSNGSSAELKQVAQKIIDDARKDNTELTDFMGKHQASGNSDYAKKAMDIMMKGSPMSHTGSTDQQFAMAMAMHHQHGIDMSKEYLKSAKEEQTKKVANNTIKSNSADLKVLKNWQSNNKSDTTGHSGH